MLYIQNQPLYEFVQPMDMETRWQPFESLSLMQNSVLVILSELFGFVQPPWVMSAMETKWQRTQSEETMAAKSENHMAAGQVLRPKGS